MGKKKFNGIIRLDVRDSTEDWEPYLAPKAPKGAPNVLFILFDDTGLAAWEPFGGKINMPTLKKIAANGLRYTQWHTAALCSPTRGMLLTGRNHHLNGNASITEGANGFPGQHARIPDECATVAQVLQDAGWSTFWVGKNHNVPETDVALGSTKKQWPLAKGFDRFYGFIGGETNQYFPDLIEDNHPVEQPYVDGYHLNVDLVDHAIQMIKDQKASNPSKPWYMWFCPGANHAPHQVPTQLIQDWGYREMFTEGYEQYRIDVLKNMKELGIVPEGTKLTDLNPLAGTGVENEGDRVIPWDHLDNPQYTQYPPGLKELFTTMMQVYATYSEHTDREIGRIIEYLKQTDQLDNTLIIYAADNGASGEGSPFGSVNENKFFNGYPDDPGDNLAMAQAIGMDKLGGPDTYEHFPTGWAAALSTPFKMFKRYSEYAGGTCDPLVMSWPARIPVDQQGQLRHQYHHCVDIVPTILEACGVEMPEVYKGAKQHPLSGVSMCYTWDAEPDAPTKKLRQYYAMLGTRALWEKGWKAVSLHAPLSGKGDFGNDKWELYHVDEDRSESKDLAESKPEKLAQLIDAWYEEAEKNLVLPLDDRDAAQQLGVERPSEEEPRESYDYFPGAHPVPEAVAVNIRGRSYTIRAEITFRAGCEGVIFAHGSRFGGHTLFIQGGCAHYVYNFLGMTDRQYKFSSGPLTEDVHVLEVTFTKDAVPGANGESTGTTTFAVDDVTVDTKWMCAQTGKFTLSGDGLCIGYDSADHITKDYGGDVEHGFPFRNGTIHKVTVTPLGEQTIDKKLALRASFALD